LDNGGFDAALILLIRKRRNIMGNFTFEAAVERANQLNLTANGMTTLATSLDPCVDLFFQIGSSRGKELGPQFERAYLADPSIAVRILFWTRDVRGGAGERETFRRLMQQMEANHPDVTERVLNLIPEYGRWDDLLIFSSTRIKLQAYSLINRALRSGNGLAAKWMPRQGRIAKELRHYMNETPKGYRKLLVGLTKVVEQQMCARQWEGIRYDHVPSVAAARYQKAFGRHDPTGYTAYKESLASGEGKINAGAVYPYDVIKSVHKGDSQVALAQWEALPNYLGDDFILPMVDVSGSMEAAVGKNKNLTCMDVAVSLGLYLADKQAGAFKDAFLTFSANSKIQFLKGDLLQKLSQLKRADWGMNTSIESAFKEILRVAKEGNVPQEQMPKYLLVLSDIEWDAATRSYGSKPNPRGYEMAQAMFEAEGYSLPKVVYWNLNARDGGGNVPVRFDENGTALISGFSPSIMRSILGAKSFTPMDIMMETINGERYAPVAAAL
jgi:hypothetical protein